MSQQRLDDIFKRVESVRYRFNSIRVDIGKTHVDWKTNNDARMTVVTDLENILEMVVIEHFMLKEMMDGSFYTRYKIQHTADAQRKINQRFFDTMRYDFALSMFNNTERYIRVFLRALDSTAYHNTTGKYKSVYESLLGQDQLNLDSKEYDEALELLYFMLKVRNTIHNGGIYFSTSGKNELVNYKGRAYNFENEKMIQFLEWELLIEMIQDVYELFLKIINNKKISTISSIANPIADFYSSVMK